MSLPIIAGVVSAAGSLASGLYSMQVANNNAKIAEQYRDYAMQAGGQKATLTSMKGAAKVANIKAAQAASGIDVNTGSAAEVQASARETAKLDAETVLHDAGLEAYGYTVKAQQFKEQGTQDMIGAFFNATGDLLGSAKAWPTGSTSTAAASSGGDLWGGYGGVG